MLLLSGDGCVMSGYLDIYRTVKNERECFSACLPACLPDKLDLATPTPGRGRMNALHGSSSQDPC